MNSQKNKVAIKIEKSKIKEENSLEKISMNNVETKVEIVIKSLNEIKEAAILNNDKESEETIEWCINQIQNEKIYEFESNKIFGLDRIKERTKNEGIGWMIQYSNALDEILKMKDFKKTFENQRKLSCEQNEKINCDCNKTLLRKSSRSTKEISRISIIFSIKNEEVENNIIKILKLIDAPEYDIFELDKITSPYNIKGSLITAFEIVNKIGIIASDNLDENILNNFLVEAIKNYSREEAYYHNDLHGADVMQTVYTMIVRGNLQISSRLDDISVFAMLIGSLCHDLRHPGQNNAFQINAKTKIALRYNDKSVLENYHISNTFKLIQKEEFNIFKTFNPEEYRIMRRRIIEGILATDMANHHKVLNEIKNKSEAYNVFSGKNFTNIFSDSNVNKLFDSQQEVLNLIIHMADISNSAKPGKISCQWTEKVYEEFFRQGDLEKKLGLPVSILCDRKTTNINKAMIGFMNYIVGPTIDILLNILPSLSKYKDYFKENLSFYQEEYNLDQKSKDSKNDI